MKKVRKKPEKKSTGEKARKKYGKQITEKSTGKGTGKKYGGKSTGKKVRAKVTCLPVTSLLVKHAHGITSGSSSSLLRKCGFVRPHILLSLLCMRNINCKPH